ncbi:hypothetical protein GCM10011415_27810 [Salipiger pallidus]|uniref:Uncharacterized protein n=1 Tax=Salipiger pallidus TaxID=1775170 RepID=A0A8J2ZLF1_9RHOB|nr:hypothetical protein [Salipiger pallidus]GGG77359.1 hypothetical protein GCM10011415_27810 [Salipiger pallidus]
MTEISARGSSVFHALNRVLMAVEVGAAAMMQIAMALSTADALSS